MPREQLHRTLDELHRQLESTADIDASARDHLQAAMQDIRRALAESAPSPAGSPPTMVDRLNESIDHFEQDHPRLTQTLVQLIEALRRAGF